MKKNNVLVLGANGFIGGHVVNALSEDGFKVRAFDRFHSDSQIKFNANDNVEIFNGDFMNQDDIKTSLRGINSVIHLISTTTPATAESDPIIDINTNITGSVQLFQNIAESGGVDKVIYMSSGGTVYGDRNDRKPVKETDNTWPISPYGIGKSAVENYLHYFDKKYNQDYTVLRLANPYGLGQDLMRKQGVIPIFTDKIMREEEISVMGDGNMIRDYIFVDDVAKIVVESLKKRLKHSVYNVGSGTGYSVNDIISEIENATEKQAKISRVPTPSSFVDYSVLDTTRMDEEFSDIQKTNLSDGIRLLVDEYKKEEN